MSLMHTLLSKCVALLLLDFKGQEGMQTLDQDLQRLVSKGEIDKSEAKYVSENPELFEKVIF